MEQLSKLYYQSKFLHRAVHRLLDKFVSEEHTWVLPVWTGPLKGLYLDLNLQWEREFLLSHYEEETVTRLRRLTRPGMTCFDVGAHVGYFTLYLGRLVGASGQVIAFEPSPPVRARLERNIAHNAKRLLARMRVEPYAVSDQPGHARFYKGGATSTGRLVRIPANAPSSDLFDVECVTLDQMVLERGLPKPDLVKMDVEYVEDRVVSGMSRLLGNVRPIIVCEVHDLEAGTRVWTRLDAAYYRVWSVEQDREWRSAADVTRGHLYALPQA